MSKKTKQAAPKLRFKEFRESWSEIRIEQISKIVTSGSRDWAQYYSTHGVKFIRMTNLDRHRINLLLDDIQYVSLPPNHSEGQRTALKPDDILISITAELGKIGIVPNNLGEAYISQHVGLIRPDSHQINPTFLAIQLSTRESNKRLNRLNDSGAKSGLNLGSIRNFLIETPSILEQEKIASFLGAIDTRLTQLRRKHELLQTYKRGVMQKLFSQQIRFKCDDGKPFPDWEKKKLGEIFDFYRGGLLSKSDLDNRGRNLCVHYGQLFTIYKEVIQHIESRTNIKDGFKSKIGDILMPSSDVTPIGLATASAILKENVFLGGDMNILRYKKPINSICASYLLNFEKKKIIELVSGITVRHIYSKDLKRLALCFPNSIEEQEKIADFLTTIDKKIEAVAQQINLTEQFKKGLLQKMFV